MDNLAAYEPALRARDRRRYGAALLVAAWAVGDLLSATVPELSANRGLVLLHYLSLIASAALLQLSVAAPVVPAANRAADRLEGWVRAMTRPLLLHLRVRPLVRAAFLFTVGGVAELVVYTTIIPGNVADPNQPLVMLWFLFFIGGILLVFHRVAASDLPDGENAAARLELEEI